jgi:mRNA-degrading endonuclease HigB of HigAB toxin-antitoxin module
LQVQNDQREQREQELRCQTKHSSRQIQRGDLPFVPDWDYIARMRIIAVSYLRFFWESNPDAEQPLKSWVDEVKKANWSQPSDIKAQYRSASILKNRRVVFNIKGNDYRLVPPCQNSCRLDGKLNQGATRKRDGTIRRSLQKQSGGADVAAGEREDG